MVFLLYILKKWNFKYVDSVDENDDDDDYSDLELFDDCGEKKKCIFLGSLKIKVFGYGLDWLVKVVMMFSGMEFIVEVWNEYGECIEVFFDLFK